MKTALDRCRDVIELAGALGVPVGDGAAAGLVGHCRRQVEDWVRRDSSVNSIDDVDRVVCGRLGLTIEEAWTDGDLGEISRRYLMAGEPVFACLAAQFDNQTYAVLIRRRQSCPDGKGQYVAVIDCRGRKKHRHYFSRWHEIAHMMTLPPPVGAPVHRSREDRSALERLMDMIAADLGFFEPLFGPMVAAEIRSAGGLTFAGAERVRRAFSPSASYEATLGACVERLGSPTVLVEAGLGLNAAEERRFAAEPVPSKRPKPQLRVLKAVCNQAARSMGLVVRWQRRVPEESMIRRVFFDRNDFVGAGEVEFFEESGLWRSLGLAWPGNQLRMVLTNRRNRVLALLFPSEDKGC